MNPKRSSLFFWGVTGFLLFVTLWLTQQNRQQLSSNTSAPLLNFSIQSIQSFTITNFTQGLKFLQNTDGSWSVAPHTTDLQKKIANTNLEDKSGAPQKADREKINAYLTKLTLIKLQTPIATTTKPAEFQINPNSLQIEFYTATQEHLGTLFIGKKGLDQTSTYVMRAGEAEVYWLPQDIRAEALMPLEYWLDTIKTHD